MQKHHAKGNTFNIKVNCYNIINCDFKWIEDVKWLFDEAMQMAW